MSRFARLGRHIAELQDRKLSARQRQAATPTGAIGEQLLRKSRQRRRRRQIATGATLAVLVAAGSLTAARLMARHEEHTVAMVHALAGQRVNPTLLDISVVFDDGSRAVVASGSSLRTEMIGPASASLRLEHGQVRIRVNHTKATHFTVHAGPYAVAVTGTQFHVKWRPEKGAFSVGVDEGNLRVSGGLLDEPVDIRRGQSLSLEHGREPPARAVEPAAPSPSSAFTPPALPANPAAEPPPVLLSPAGDEAPAPLHRPAARHLPSPTWRQQAAAGRYREALEEAERQGFEGICRDASSAELLTLAEAARYASHSERAEQALKAVRSRFGRGEDSAMAAYLLGRISAEVRHDYAGAANWFRTYLVERPGGRLTREAEGRLLESLAFMDRNTAREAARTYLEHYPSGPHATFARNLLGH
jgi:hypothetical protein